MSAKTMAEVLAEHQFSMFDEDGHAVCTCDETVVGIGEDWEEYPAHQAAALSAAGFGLVADAKAEALEAAAGEYQTRGETFAETSRRMAQNREYGADDIIRYGAYSSEANRAAYWLRARAAAVRGEG